MVNNNMSGMNNPMAKLTQDDIEYIRNFENEHETKFGWKSKLAREFNVTPAAITHILNNSRWRNNDEGKQEKNNN